MGTYGLEHMAVCRGGGRREQVAVAADTLQDNMHVYSSNQNGQDVFYLYAKAFKLHLKRNFY